MSLMFLKPRPPRLPSLAWLGLAAVALTLFCLYAFLPLLAAPIPTSPDESANLFFSRWFAQTNQLHYFDVHNLFSGGANHPRSMTVSDGFLVPVGFVGLPLFYGMLAKVVGTAAIPFFTPFVALLGVVGFGLLSARLLGRRAGWMAAALLALHPVWWYETARTMQSAALFSTLVIWGTWFLVAAPFESSPRRKGRVSLFADGLIAGALFALALAVRLSEAYWLAFVALVVVATVRPLPWRRFMGAALGGLLGIAPFLCVNYSLYGHLLTTGYGSLGQGGVTGERLQGLGMRLLGPLQPYLFPLGFAPRTALSHFWTYGLAFLPWWSLAVAAAAAYALRLVRCRAFRHPLVLAVLAASSWLVLFYGSWTVYDSPDPKAVSIGSSYLRYWLPLFMASIWPVAWAAARLWEDRRHRRLILGLAAVFAACSVLTVFGAPGEGLLSLRATNARYARVKAGVLSLTAAQDVIVVDRADKFLFPDRSVVVPLRSQETFRAVAKLFGRYNVYYFGVTFPEKDLLNLNYVQLVPYGLRVEPVRQFDNETLYRFVAAATLTDRP